MTIVTKNRITLPTDYQLQEYRIQSVLGQGELGITYLAQDTKLNRQVAIKEYFPKDLGIREINSSVVRPQSQEDKNFDWGLERFLQEGQAFAAIQHPNLVRVLRCFEAHRTAYIIMEYEKGQSLSTILSKGALTETEILKFLPPLLSALQAIHEAGFLHQDIKPDNIYLRDQDRTPVLLNFGIACYAVARLRRDVVGVVTPGYTAFEQYQIQGPQGPWTDIYAFGAVLYCAISGKTPINALERIDAIKRRKETDPLPPITQVGDKQYSKRLLEGIDWALQIAEEDRPQMVQLWAKALLPQTYLLFKFRELSQWMISMIKRLNPWMLVTIIVIFMVLNIIYTFYLAHSNRQLQQQTEALQQLQQQNVARQKAWQQDLEKVEQQFVKARDTLVTLENQLEQSEVENSEIQKKLETTQELLNKTLLAKEKAEARQPGEIIQDRLLDGCLGPDMVWIPAGQFRMGDIQGQGNNDEGPVHWVSINSFAMGRFEVTFADYDRFAEATGREKPDDNGWGRDKRPVINISWYDAIAYAQWLSVQTGQIYRLPTEAEWEYGARAGTMTQYWWGDEVKQRLEHCDGCGTPENDQTMIVGSLSPNPYGLYDISGNVREWTCSGYEPKYRGHERFCLNPNHAGYRVERGGSWINSPMFLRVSARFQGEPKERYINVGFRLVREERIFP
jgi:formylglycine-generating enzyme required for sulfatase activity